MQKIMFNDRYGLTQAVIEGRKMITRRIEGGGKFQEMADCAWCVFYDDLRELIDFINGRPRCSIHIYSHKTRYKVGEVVAVAQSYEQVYRSGNMDADDAIIASLKYDPGMSNKMYVRADLMPHRIRITGIRCERLQDISDADCLNEGIQVEFANNGRPMYYYFDTKRWRKVWFDTHHEAFASLIDKVSGRGIWKCNPWVVVYEFELVK